MNLVNPFTAVYKCTLYARGGSAILMLLWCYNFIQNHNNCRGLQQFFSCLFETFGSMSEIMFSSDSMSKNFFNKS